MTYKDISKQQNILLNKLYFSTNYELYVKIMLICIFCSPLSVLSVSSGP